MPSTSKFTKTQRNLNPKAMEIVHDFIQNVSLNPTLEQRAELLAKIHQFPGTEWYTARNLRDVFRGRRDTEARAILKRTQAGDKGSGKALEQNKRILAVASAHKLLWPTLDEDKVSKLTVLSQENTSPDQTAVCVWSRALKADQCDIENWLRVYGFGSWNPSEQSALPESSTSSSPTFSREASDIFDTLSDPASSVASVQSHFNLASLPPTRQEPFVSSHARSLNDLASFLNQRLSATEGEGLSVEEFDEHMQASLAFFEKIQNGAFTRFGLCPSSFSGSE